MTFFPMLLVVLCFWLPCAECTSVVCCASLVLVVVVRVEMYSAFCASVAVDKGPVFYTAHRIPFRLGLDR